MWNIYKGKIEKHKCKQNTRCLTCTLNDIMINRCTEGVTL